MQNEILLQTPSISKMKLFTTPNSGKYVEKELLYIINGNTTLKKNIGQFLVH